VKSRHHLFEFGDLPWFPQVLRDAETALLVGAYRLLPALRRRWADKISTVLTPDDPVEIVDLCSGSGGAMPWIVDELVRRGYNVHATLTDLYVTPQRLSHSRLKWLAEPVDATRVPAALTGARTCVFTMFSAFHHFRPDAAKAILKDAFDRHRAICIFESGTGGLLAAIGSLGMPAHVLVLMPFARPFRWANVVFTYLLPIVPLLLMWDAIVSNLRIYLPAQMQELTADLQAPDYTWEIGAIRLFGLPIGFPYLIGRPSP
jgi:hypothetical protein